jgi:hypothetical protein
MCREVLGYRSASMFIVGCGVSLPILHTKFRMPVQISLLFTMRHADFAGEFRRKQ